MGISAIGTSNAQKFLCAQTNLRYNCFTIESFYGNDDTIKNPSLQSSISVKLVDFHHNYDNS